MNLWHFSALTAGICALWTLGCALYVASAARGMASLAKLTRSHESRIASLQESTELLTAELERLAQRVKMQRVRNATEHATKSKSAGDMPDPVAYPNEWRAAMNRKIAEAKTGVKL